MTEYPPHSEPEMWQKELSAILRQRQAARETHQPQWRRKRAELRRGLSPFTEYYAYPHVLPYLRLTRTIRRKRSSSVYSR